MSSEFYKIKGTVKLYINKSMTTSSQVTNTETFVFMAGQVLKLLSHKVLFINRKTIETVKKLATF